MVPQTTVYLKYARTYEIVDEFGRIRQGWLFLVNGRWNFDDMDASPFPRPPCDDYAGGATGFGGPWFTGFIEYVSSPEGGSAEGQESVFPGDPPPQPPAVSLCLSHQPGCLSHYEDPTFNHQAIAPGSTTERHESYSYHFVAPAPFTDAVSVAMQPPGGALDFVGATVESFRSNTSLLMPALLKEIPVLNVTTGPTTLNCTCNSMVPGGIGIYFEHSLDGDTQCGTAAAVHFATAVPMYQQFVGEWAMAPGLYPFKRKLWTNGGTFGYADTQCGFPSSQPTFHFTHGVSLLFDEGSATLRLFGNPGTFSLMTDFTNSLELIGLSQAAMLGTETLGIASWHLNR